MRASSTFRKRKRICACAVLIDQLRLSPRQQTYLPSSDDKFLAPVLEALEHRPADNTSLAAWAARVYTTERTLSRRCQHDLGMSFSEWRQRLVSCMPCRCSSRARPCRTWRWTSATAPRRRLSSCSSRSPAPPLSAFAVPDSVAHYFSQTNSRKPSENAVKILVDENMPYAAELFSRPATCRLCRAARSRVRRWRMPMR